MSKQPDTSKSADGAVSTGKLKSLRAHIGVLSLEKGILGTSDFEHCEFCGRPLENSTDECPALEAGGCQP